MAVSGDDDAPDFPVGRCLGAAIVRKHVSPYDSSYKLL